MMLSYSRNDAHSYADSESRGRLSWIISSGMLTSFSIASSLSSITWSTSDPCLGKLRFSPSSVIANVSPVSRSSNSLSVLYLTGSTSLPSLLYFRLPRPHIVRTSASSLATTSSASYYICCLGRQLLGKPRGAIYSVGY